MKPRHELSAREIEQLLETLSRRLGDSSVPTLPQVAVKVIQLVSSPSSSINDFVAVIQTDQALTGRLLRTANSAYYAQRAPVTQLQRAMLLLGIDRLKALALGFHLSHAALSDAGDFSIKRLWTRSIFRAWTAFRLAEHFDRTLAGEAFVVGLMLDAGVPMVRSMLGDEYTAHVKPGDPPGRQFACEFKHLPFTHVDVAAALSRLWKLPETLSRPICLHHQAPESMDVKNQASVLHAIAYCVGSLALHGTDTDMASSGPLARSAGRIFNLQPADFEKTLRDAAGDFRASRELFLHILDDSLSLEAILASANRELCGAVEELVEGAMQAESQQLPAQHQPPAKFETGSLVLELEPAPGNKVTVFIADSTGARLLSEDIDPRGKDRAEMRRLLLMDDAEDRLVDDVIRHMHRLAA